MKLNNYLIEFSYDGSEFFGYQKQKDKLTVQGDLERVLSRLDNKNVKVTGSGRTDVGVHALSQTANFKLCLDINPNKLKNLLNHQLNKAIYINKCILTTDDFHSRFSAKEKTYKYKIKIGNYNPLLINYMLQLKSPLNIKAMKKASKIFLGEHDFENFVSGKRDNYITTITNIKIYKKKCIIIKVTGKHFYQYMVRNIVGALIEVGLGKADIDTLIKMLNKTTNQKLPTAFPQGLYLEKIKY